MLNSDIFLFLSGFILVWVFGLCLFFLGFFFEAYNSQAAVGLHWRTF